MLQDTDMALYQYVDCFFFKKNKEDRKKKEIEIDMAAIQK